MRKNPDAKIGVTPHEGHTSFEGSKTIDKKGAMTIPTSRQRLSMLGRFTLAVTMLGPCTAADAATFVVNSTADDLDALPGDGVCDNGAGDCTLRAAVIEANHLPGADTIVFGFKSAATFPLTLLAATKTLHWRGTSTSRTRWTS